MLGAVVIALASVLMSQGRPVCEIVAEKDAAAVIGPVKQKQTILGADQCVFNGEGLLLSINRLSGQEPATVTLLLAVPKTRARAGDVVKDEPGIGTGAVSETSKGRTTIIAATGDTVWTLAVEHVYNKDLSETLPTLRELAKKVISSK